MGDVDVIAHNIIIVLQQYVAIYNMCEDAPC